MYWPLLLCSIGEVVDGNHLADLNLKLSDAVPGMQWLILSKSAKRHPELRFMLARAAAAHSGPEPIHRRHMVDY